jgi:hypothetical protein
MAAAKPASIATISTTEANLSAPEQQLLEVGMHNMTTENECDQYSDYSFYDLTGDPVRVQRREDRVTRFINSYHAI